MAAVPALSQAYGPATAPRVPGFGSPYQRLRPGGRPLPVKRRARLQDLCARGGRPGPKTSATEDVQPTVGTKVLKGLPGTQNISRSRDSNVIFVAGATGRVGSRVVRELLKLGYRVRAGVRNLEKAQGLLELADELKAKSSKKRSSNFFSGFSADKLFGFFTPSQDRPIELVECDLESREGLQVAFGNAGVVVCSIGASEKEVLDVTGPYRIDYQATKNLIEAATEAKVNHFILVTSLGTTKIGWPASALNLFWGVLVWKAKAEKLLEESGVPFTIIRPGGMERPTDAFKETHNLLLAKADTYSGNQVSNLQVAELIACAVNNFELVENKIIEAIAETSAPLRPIEDMLAEIPAKVVPTGSKVAKEATKKVYAEDNEDDPKAEAEMRQRLLERYKNELVAAKEQEEKARIDAEAALQEKVAIEKKAAELRIKAEAANLAARQAMALQEAFAVAASEGRLLTDQERQSLVASIKSEAKKQNRDVKPPSDAQQVKVTQDTSEQERPSTKKRFQWPWGPEPEVELAAAVTASTTLERKTEAEEIPSEEVPAAPEVVVEEVTAQTEELPSEEIGAAPEVVVEEVTAQGKQSSVPDQDPPETTAVLAEPRENQEERVEATDQAVEGAPPVETIEDQQVEEPVGETFAIKEEVTPEPAIPFVFRWPWQKSSASSTSEPETTQPETVETDGDSIASPPNRPQSPYARYPDLRPPTSPSPKKPADSGPEISNGALLESPTPAPPRRPQSPYAMYPDLRPPASPSPSPPRS